ncbi:DUF2127 domain-containing protein [Diaminobutyricibacter sp. McL0618]|uniref:DUF2127 domain-containing protein n=1 Tax=Leifsonia sp. McL0618 TaxID=3415677 RepID=UPI003CF83829
MTTTQTTQTSHRLLDRTFFIVMIIKGIDGVLELIGGLLLLFVTPAQIGYLAHLLTQHELSEEPHDFIANSLLHFTNGLNHSATLFGAIYLLLHGAVKVVLVWAVLTDHLWAFPWTMAFLAVFIVYQTYKLIVAFSWGLVALTVFDLFVLALTWREYGLHRARRRAEAVPAV